MAITAKMTFEVTGDTDEVALFYQKVFNTSALPAENPVPQATSVSLNIDDDKKKQKIVNAMKLFNQHGILLIVAVLSTAKEYAQREDVYSYASFSDIKETQNQRTSNIQSSWRTQQANKQVRDCSDGHYFQR